MGRPAQFNNVPPKYGQPQQHSQPPVGYTYEPFQTPAMASKPPSLSSSSKTMSMASSPAATPRHRDYVADTDATMEDADPYNRSKYPTRPHHQSRPSAQYFPTEESSAARRYSPMNAVPPAAGPYSVSPGKSQNAYAFPPGPNPSQPSRRSPTRSNYASPPLAYQSPPCELLPCV